MGEKVSIIIPAWNCFGYTQNCLRHIEKYTDVSYELILINNGSHDGTEWLFKQYKDAKIITNPNNIGRPAAYNQGMLEANGEYILLLHNDVVVAPNWLAKMINCLKSNPGVGMVGPRTSNAPVTGDRTLYFKTLTDMFTYTDKFSQPDPGKWYEVTQWLPGFCLLIRREVIQRVGILDEQFKYGFFDEMDYSRRVKEAGYKLMCAGDTFVHHFGGRTLEENNLQEKNKERQLDVGLILEKYRLLYQAKWQRGGNSQPAETMLFGFAPEPVGQALNIAENIALALAQPPPAKSPDGPVTSIIIPCCNEGEYIKKTVESMQTAKSAVAYEIIVVDDGSTDGCCDFLRDEEKKGIRLISTAGVGAANARNLGVIAAKGDNYVFCDAHIFVGDGWLDSLTGSLAIPDVDVVVPGIVNATNPGSPAGYGQTWDDKLATVWFNEKPAKLKEVPLAPGGCLAVRAAVFREVGGFETGFKKWGFEDVELSLKLWLFGFKIYVNPNVTVQHVFRTSQTYFIRDEEYHYNYLRMAFSHFNRKRIEKILASALHLRNAHITLTDLLFSDIWEQRRRYMARRKFDDDWFMQKFSIPF